MTTQDAYMSVITGAISNQPRSRQRTIGPSEIGITCDRRILHKLAGTPEPSRPVAWKPVIGTAVHAQLEAWFTEDANWMVETRVSITRLHEQITSGTCDLYHIPSGTVIDHKIVGTKMLQKYRSQGPSVQYRTQAHLYACGFSGLGLKANRVAISFLPRDGELRNAYWWEEPYNPHIVDTALNRLTELATDLRQNGLEIATGSKALCDDFFCPWCPPLKRENLPIFDR